MARAARRGDPLGALASLVWTAALLALALGVFLIWDIHRPGPATQATAFSVDRGASVMDIAHELKTRGVIRDVVVFRIASEMYALRGALKAGDYEAEPGESLRSLLEKIEAGKMKLTPITVAEGLTSAMIIKIVKDADVLTGDPPPVPAEGSLLPETYMVLRGSTRAEVIARMREDQQRVLDELWPKRQTNLPLKSPQEALILASIVEKETGVPAERAQVAGVFVNRLRKGMRLETDPTIIYGVCRKEPRRCIDGKLVDSRGANRGIRQSEMAMATGYNTYQIAGLPPTPIANPGRASIEAVLNPASTDALFFVADGTGGHAFAATVEEHNRNVAQWREIERQRAARPATP